MWKRTPALVGGLAVQFFQDRFKRQGWLDRRFEPWPKRKREDRNPRRRAILVKTGRLRRSIRVASRTASSVLVGTDVPYAQVHNEGFSGPVRQNVRAHNVRAHSRKRDGRRERVRAHSRQAHARTMQQNIPQRRFMGESDLLNRRIERHLENELRKELSFLTNI